MLTPAQLQSKYPTIEWDLSGVDPKVYTEIVAAFEKQVEKYPVLLSQLVYIGTRKTLPGKMVALAHVWNPDTTDTEYTCVCLNPYYYGNYRLFTAEARKSEQNHFHPTGLNTIADSFTHELGHILMQALLSRNDVALTPFVGADNFGLVGRTVELWMQSNHADKSLSTYATQSPNEAWAEGFSAIESGSPRVPYTASQAKLLKWIMGTAWHTAKQYAGTNRSEMDRLAQLAREYQIRRPEADMYQKIRADMAETRKELDGEKKDEPLAEKMGGDVSTLFSQLHALLSQLEAQFGGGVTDPAISGCRIGASEWKEFSESVKHKT